MGHDGPEHVIEVLTTCIDQQGPSVSLLLNRASQYRVLSRLNEAASDLQWASQLEPHHQGVRTELARIYLVQGQIDQAMSTINRAIQTVPIIGSSAHLWTIRAKIHAASQQYELAIHDYNDAIEANPSQIEWYLLRSHLQQRMGMTGQRIQGLRDGYIRTQSAVVHTEWVEALLDGQQPNLALPEIEIQLQQTRLKSSWLIRRARARQQLGQAKQARGDLHAAVNEINARLHPTRPDPRLTSDLTLARHLLDNLPAAHLNATAAQKISNAPATNRIRPTAPSPVLDLDPAIDVLDLDTTAH